MSLDIWGSLLPSALQQHAKGLALACHRKEELAVQSFCRLRGVRGALTLAGTRHSPERTRLPEPPVLS